MGIEDFNVDLDEYADSVLVLGASEEGGSEIGALLEKRSYKWQHAKDIEAGSRIAAQELFDLIILDEREASGSAEALIARVQADAALSRSPILLIHPEADRLRKGESSIFGERVTVLPAPLEASSLLVKVAMRLRLRKIKTEQASFESRISSQNAQLRDLNNRFKRELKAARDIQQSLFPKSLPTAPNCTFAACCVPLEAVGGDLYDIWKVDRGIYGLFVGDVTGHGLAAAFIGAMTKMALAYAPKDTPEETFSHMNSGLADYMPDGCFVTAAGALYEPMEGRLRVVRAGHPPPYLWRASKASVELIEPRGLPLGINVGVPYELYETTLEPGDKFLMITDGITETADMDGKMLGVDGVGDLFAEAAKDKSIADCLAVVLDAQKKFTGGRILKDDNTLLGFENTANANDA